MSSLISGSEIKLDHARNKWFSGAISSAVMQMVPGSRHERLHNAKDQITVENFAWMAPLSLGLVELSDLCHVN